MRHYCKMIGGEADGDVIALQRAPLMLRVVISRLRCGRLHVDALDQLDDTPGDQERILVYRRQQEPESIGMFDSSQYRGPFAQWNYHYLAEPPDAEVRATEAWRAWAAAHVEDQPQ